MAEAAGRTGRVRVTTGPASGWLARARSLAREADGFNGVHLYAGWTVLATGCAVTMALRPETQTIPFHLGWASFALAFGLGTWTRWQLVTALGWYTVVTGVLLEASWREQRIGWEETSEIPLMFLLAALMVWHVRRRQVALGLVTEAADRQLRSAQDREQLMRLTSHELRTPLTIAQGHLELVQSRTPAPDGLDDLRIVGDELSRLARVGDRLVRMIQVQEDPVTEPYDLDLMLQRTIARWRVVAPRDWVLEARGGRIVGSPERLRTALDTLIENALRYTDEDDTIRLSATRSDGELHICVYDSGDGLSDAQIAAINAGRPSPSAPEAPMDTSTALRLSGTGLGLSIVRAMAEARGGSLRAGRAAEGGAALMMSIPLLVAPDRARRA